MLPVSLISSLQAIIADLEESREGSEDGEKTNQDVVIRKLMRRKSKRETKAIWCEIRNGVLRRSNSVEDVSENMNHQQLLRPGQETQAAVSHTKSDIKPVMRQRHNSEGNYDDVEATMARISVKNTNDDPGAATNIITDNVYENVTFFQGSAQMHGDKDKNISSKMVTGRCDKLNADIHKFISHHSSSR